MSVNFRRTEVKKKNGITRLMPILMVFATVYIAGLFWKLFGKGGSPLS